MNQKKNIPEEIRRGREAAVGLLVAEVCLCGERVASLFGIREWFESIAIPRIIISVLIFLYYYVIKKPRLVDTPQWYVLLSKDKVIWVLSTLAMIILITSIGT